MLDALPYFSKTTNRFLLTALAASLLGGCSTNALENREFFEEDNRAFFEEIKIDQDPENDDDEKDKQKPKESHVKKRESETDTKVGLELRPDAAKATQALRINPKNLSRVKPEADTATCRYLRTTADSEAIIVASPTLRASSDEDGAGSVSIGMNLLDIQKGKLLRASGDAKCRLHEASTKINSTHKLGLEATRFTRAWAKQAHIRKNLGYLKNVHNRAHSLKGQGVLTVQEANVISRQIEQLKAEMEKFRVEADQRRDLPAVEIKHIRSRHGALVEATNDLQNIDREIRTNDALELSISAGYRYNGAFNDTLRRNESDGPFAKVNLGVRLGALSPRREQLEREAAGARLDALFEEHSGTIWKAGFSDKAMKRMIADLERSHHALTAAMSKSRDTINRLTTENSPQIVRAMLIEKINHVRIGSEHAAVHAAIKQLRNNRKNLKSLSE